MSRFGTSFYGQEVRRTPFRFMSRDINTWQQLTLLIVAPNKEILHLVKAILSAENHRVLVANDEDQAFTLVLAEQPDVVLATSGVHEIGPRLCQRIRQDEALSKTPFILLTTSGNRRSYSTYFANGCDQILPVPFKCADIYKAIDNARKHNRDKQKSLIHVLLKSGLAEYVEPAELDHLLANREVLCFRRNSGLAIIGRDPIRRGNHSSYSGPERRMAIA